MEEVTCKHCGQEFYIRIGARWVEVCPDCVEAARPDTIEEARGER